MKICECKSVGVTGSSAAPPADYGQQDQSADQDRLRKDFQLRAAHESAGHGSFEQMFILHLIAFIHLEFQIPRAIVEDRQMQRQTTKQTDIWS